MVYSSFYVVGLKFMLHTCFEWICAVITGLTRIDEFIILWWGCRLLSRPQTVLARLCRQSANLWLRILSSRVCWCRGTTTLTLSKTCNQIIQQHRMVMVLARERNTSCFSPRCVASVWCALHCQRLWSSMTLHSQPARVNQS